MTGIEHGIGDTQHPYSFEDTIWNGNTILRDEELLQRNLGVMRLLLAAGGVPTDLIDNDYAANLPKIYDFGGVEVEFLPHWGFYKVGKFNLGIPEASEMLLADLEAAKYIASRQPSAK